MAIATAAHDETALPRTAEEIERDWFENVYQGDKQKQLTARAILMGMLLGMIMACSNVYIGLKAGWSMGVTITSSTISSNRATAVGNGAAAEGGGIITDGNLTITGSMVSGNHATASSPSSAITTVRAPRARTS